MDFTPNQTNPDPFAVPYFDEVAASDGWQGQTTGKSIEALKSEITQALSRLGATVVNFQQGVFGAGSKAQREGFMLYYTFEGLPGQVKIAALPVKPPTSRNRGGHAARKQQALRMALFMFRDYCYGMWYAQKLSPGYLPLVPWLLGAEGATLTETWADRMYSGMLLQPGDETDFIDGVFEEKE